jgi:siroheme synthase
MPFAVVAQGTSNQQQVVVGTVSDIAKKVQQTAVTSPALLIMGEVVSANGYAEQLAEQSVQQLMSVASMV